MNRLQAVILALLIGGQSTASAQVQIKGLDTDWKKVGTRTWVRSIGSFAGSAEITVSVRYGRVWYLVETPCVQSPEVKRTLIWQAGEKIGSEHSCENERTESDMTTAWETVAGPLPPDASVAKLGIPI